MCVLQFVGNATTPLTAYSAARQAAQRHRNGRGERGALRGGAKRLRRRFASFVLVPQLLVATWARQLKSAAVSCICARVRSSQCS